MTGVEIEHSEEALSAGGHEVLSLYYTIFRPLCTTWTAYVLPHKLQYIQRNVLSLK